jgi:spermidine synthase
MAAQIVFLREFLVIFSGNELSIGIVLANWLLWGAVGSAAAGRLAAKTERGYSLFAFNQLLFAIALPVFFLLIRGCRPALGIVPGEIPGYPLIYSYSFVLLSVPCMLSGALFSCGCRIYKAFFDESVKAVSNVYILEALGALSGGVLAGMTLLVYLPQYFLLLFLSFSNMCFSVLIFYLYGKALKKRYFPAAASFIFLIFFTLFVLSGQFSKLETFSFNKQWKGFNVIASGDSVYGNVTITGAGGQFSFYENGLYLYSLPDRIYAEELTHLNMAQNRDFKKVLLIGGGPGVLREVLKYDLSGIDYVELDPLIVSLGRKYLSGQYARLFSDERVNIIYGDGRAFTRSTCRKYDNVIISAGDPYTAFTNRYYTLEFFEQLKRILNPGAVVSFALTSSANYLSEEAVEYLGSIYNTVTKIFPEVMLVPGDTMYFIFSEKKGSLVHDSFAIEKSLDVLGIKTMYARDYYLSDKLSDSRIKYAEKIISSANVDAFNSDFHPVTYFYSSKFWNSQFENSLFSRILEGISAKAVIFFFVCFLLLSAIVKWFYRYKRPDAPYYISIFSTGFSEMVFQIITIIAFQSLYGFVYYKMGIIFASFMVGLAMGGLLYNRYLIGIKKDVSLYRFIQCLIIIYPLVLPVILFTLDKNSSAFFQWAGSVFILPLLPVIPGVIGGVQFAAANSSCKRVFSGTADEIKSASILYAVDLIGSATGAILAAAILIPILGLKETSFLCAFINLSIFFLLPSVKHEIARKKLFKNVI